MVDRVTQIGRIGIVLLGIAVATVVGWYVFWVQAGTLADLFGVLLIVGTVAVGGWIASGLADKVFADYNVAEVAVDDPITRDGGGFLPTSPGTTPADDIVEQIENADEDDDARALLLKMNTPGGEVVPSDDIREAAMDFDGPTIAYATDLCASGGMWIASGCDELWARDASIVGSIGVLFSQTRFDDFADEYGINYERIVSGEYKDALSARFKALEDHEREYLQGLSDAWYEEFVERMADGTDLDEGTVRDTEARVYLGKEAHEMGMIDELGDRDDIEEQLEGELDEPVTVEEFEPEKGLTDKLSVGARGIAFAFGAGVARAVVGETDQSKLR